MIRAITFDFWDTLFVDDSDEPRRSELGLPPKPVARRALFTAVVTRHHPDISTEQAELAFDAANAWFHACWKQDHHTPTVSERLDRALAELRLDRPPGFDAMVDTMERMELDLPPDLAPGAAELLGALAGRYKLGIISDAIVTPGRYLRRILKEQGLVELFDCFIFSDEAGASKPARAVFDAAAAGLGVPHAQILHVGDRESNDVAGPQAAGMRAALYTGIVDRGSDRTTADLICRHHHQLPALLTTLRDAEAP